VSNSTPKDTADHFEKHIDVSNDSLTAIDLLSEHTDFSRQTIKKIMQKGAVWLTQGKSTRRLRRASKKLCLGQTLHLYYDRDVLSEPTFKAQLIADEAEYSVWFKPS